MGLDLGSGTFDTLYDANGRFATAVWALDVPLVCNGHICSIFGSLLRETLSDLVSELSSSSLLGPPERVSGQGSRAP